MENSSRDGNTRPPELPLEKPICSQEATVRTGHGTTDWLQIGKGVWQTTPVLLPEKSHGQSSLVGCSPWGR